MTETNNKAPTVNLILEVGAKIPEYAHSNDIGADLFAYEDSALKRGEIKAIYTGIKIALPTGWGGFILEKSGLALKGVQVMGGVIDTGYRGEIKVILRNVSDGYFFIKKGMKIAQLEIRPVYQATFIEVAELDVTARNESGFG